MFFMMLKHCLNTDVRHQYSPVRRGPHRHADPFKMQTRGNNLPLNSTSSLISLKTCAASREWQRVTSNMALSLENWQAVNVLWRKKEEKKNPTDNLKGWERERGFLQWLPFFCCCLLCCALWTHNNNPSGPRDQMTCCWRIRSNSIPLAWA